MRLSIIVITANPTEKEYAWKEALASYADLADEVIVIDGGIEVLNVSEISDKIRVIHIPDPEVWNWAEHAKRLNRGLDEATGDWIIKTDIDWMFHEKDMEQIRIKLTGSYSPVGTFQKKTVYPFRRYIEKGSIPIAINKQDKAKVRFGKDTDEYTDLTYPIFWKGEVDEFGVPVGKLVQHMDWSKIGETVWNFDYTFTTLANAKKKFARMSGAHKVYFGESSWGENEEEAFKVFMNNMQGKLNRSLILKNLDELPKYIRSRMENIKPEEFGCSAWNLLNKP